MIKKFVIYFCFEEKLPLVLIDLNLFRIFASNFNLISKKFFVKTMTMHYGLCTMPMVS